MNIGNFGKSVASGLVGLAGLLGSGCETPQTQDGRDGQRIVTLGLALYGVQEDKPGAVELAQMIHQRDVAEAGRSEFNVNVNNFNGQHSTRGGADPRISGFYDKGEPFFYTCNGVLDLNKDGDIGPAEIIGVEKYRFGINEPICVGFNNFGLVGVRLTIKLNSPSGRNKILFDKLLTKPNKYLLVEHPYEDREFGFSRYEIQIDGQPVGSVSHEIVR